jgi:hypothetical protein
MNHLLLRWRVALGLISLLAISGWALAWDLSCPLGDAFPPGIGVTPGEPAEPGPPDAFDPSFEDRLIELVNQERWTNGQLPPLKRVAELDSSSETHSANMAGRDFVMHCDPVTLTWPWDRMVAAGYSYSSAAENIAWGYSDPAAVMAGWMSSSGHRANILSTSYREMGNGYFNETGDTGNVRRTSTTSCTPNIFNEGPFYRYWTQNFGKRNSVYPVVINREASVSEDRTVDLYLYGGWSELRLRNEGGAWTDWLPFANNLPWQLSSGNGTKTVTAEMRSGSTVVTATDTIILENTSEILFIDGFESGNTSEWSTVSP